MRLRRNLKTKTSREFWDVVDRMADEFEQRYQEDSYESPEIGDPWFDDYRDLSPSLLTGKSKR